MAHPTGRNLPLSLPRRLIGDIVHFSRHIPSVPVQRTMNVAPLAAARADLWPRPSWCAIFTKAYALVASRRPELRRAYLSLPWPRLYEHPINVASVAFERRWRNENAVLFGHIRFPERYPLEDLHQRLADFKQQPVEQISAFRRALAFARLPLPLRRLAWWLGLSALGRQRARRLGTFAVSVYAGLGASSLHPLSPLTTTLNYGPIAVDGGVDVRLIYDHRVLDGADVARALADLERVLHEEILAELRGLQPLGGGQRGRGRDTTAPVAADR